MPIRFARQGSFVAKDAVSNSCTIAVTAEVIHNGACATHACQFLSTKDGKNVRRKQKGCHEIKNSGILLWSDGFAYP